MRRCLSVLGSTGSIGTQTLDVARNLKLKIGALAARSNVRLLEEQIREFRPELAAVYEESAAKNLRLSVEDLPVKIVSGMDGLCEAASYKKADLICNSVVGLVGLQPTLAAISAGKDVALSNKETLVAGGAVVMKEAKRAGVKILPVDSEHSAIFQCLQGCPEKKALKRIILTASGGPFFEWTYEQLRHATPEQALRHPNWHMGPKVTIDSATMMNKGLEMMEASWLFDLPPSKIDILVQRESVVHSMIEYEDNSVMAQLGIPDMRLPIQYAITWPQRFHSQVKPLDLAEYGTLTFARPDEKKFKCIAVCKEAMKRGGLAPAAVNGANEAAVQLFLQHRIAFTDIAHLVYDAMESQPEIQSEISVNNILEADMSARMHVIHAVGSLG
jgi:1-deoxy-D-xylulose-5-phosphate reductoisomerase